jgi:hypothetical protein
MTGLNLYPVSIAVLAVVLTVAALCIVLLANALKTRKASEESLKTVAASIDRLEKLFDQVFADTFFVLRETLSYALHQSATASGAAEGPGHPAELAAHPAPVATSESRLSYLEKSFAELSRNQRQTADAISALRRSLGESPGEPHRVDPERGVPRANHTRSMILETLRRLQQRQPVVRASVLLSELEKEGKTALEVVRELEAIHADGLIDLSDAFPIHANTGIALK